MSTTDSTVSKEEIDFLDQICTALGASQQDRDDAVYMPTREAQDIASAMEEEKKQLLYNTLSAQINIDGNVDSEEVGRLSLLRNILGVE